MEFMKFCIKQAEIPNNVCDLESECDLFVKIYVDGNFIGQSRTNMNSNKPLFNEYFKIESVTNVSTLRLIVMDEDKLENIGSDLGDENDEIFEIFLRIDEDILNENRNGKQMEVDGYSLKGIGAMGRLVFGIHWDNKFASCDFEQGSVADGLPMGDNGSDSVALLFLVSKVSFVLRSQLNFSSLPLSLSLSLSLSLALCR